MVSATIVQQDNIEETKTTKLQVVKIVVPVSIKTKTRGLHVKIVVEVGITIKKLKQVMHHVNLVVPVSIKIQTANLRVKFVA